MELMSGGTNFLDSIGLAPGLIDIRLAQDLHQIGNGLTMNWHSNGIGLTLNCWDSCGLLSLDSNGLELFY